MEKQSSYDVYKNLKKIKCLRSMYENEYVSNV